MVSTRRTGICLVRSPVVRRQVLSIFDQSVGRRDCSVACSAVTLRNSFKCYDLEKGPSLSVHLSRDDALKMYTQMVECRRLENLSSTYYKAQKIRGFCHLYTGQEAVAVGMRAALRKNDSLITSYRCHAFTYLMGVSVQALMGELFGLRNGCSRGKGGSMHMFGENFYGGNGIVGAQVPVGAGIALAHRYRDDGGVCFALYGDGAANQGQVFEAYNMAKLWCLPCVFVCENNLYAMGTHAARGAASNEYYMRGHYIPGLWVDGNQVLAVRSATQFAIKYAHNHGPLVMEMNTYRYFGHSMSDPGTSYRTRDEITKTRETRDPIVGFRKQIIDLHLASPDELKKIDANIKKSIDQQCKKALKSKEVGLDELFADVYVKNLEPKLRSISGYNKTHIKISEVCVGNPKATPENEINDVPVGDAALIAAQLAAKKKAEEEKAAKEKAAKEAKPKPDAKTTIGDPKTKAEADAGAAAKAKAGGGKTDGEKTDGGKTDGGKKEKSTSGDDKKGKDKNA